MKLIEVQGKDATKLLSRVCSQKITPELSAGIAHILTPKGKVLCTFGLIKTSKNQLFLEVASEVWEVLKTELEKYVLREDFKLVPVENVFITRAPTSITSSLFRSIPLFYTPQKTRDSLDHLAFTELRVQHKIPLFPLDYDSNFTAVETDVIQGVDFNKGCYPGQETVSKTVFRGQTPYVLVWFQGPKSDVAQAAQACKGTCTSVYGSTDPISGFIRLPRTADLAKLSQQYLITLSRHGLSAPLPK